MTAKNEYGTLINYTTGETIRPATQAERAECDEAAECNGTGAFTATVNGADVVCWVEVGH